MQRRLHRAHRHGLVCYHSVAFERGKARLNCGLLLCQSARSVTSFCCLAASALPAFGAGPANS